MMTVSTSSTAPPRVSSPARGMPGTSEKKDKKEKKENKGGLLSAAKAKATGSLRKALYGKTKKKVSVTAEDIEEEDDYSSSNYDTVRSLPATGHYGNRGRTESTPLRVTVDHYNHQMTLPAGGGPSLLSKGLALGRAVVPPSIAVSSVIRLQRRRVSQPPAGARLSPGSRLYGNPRGVPAAPTDPDPAFDFTAWHESVDLINNEDAVYSLFMKAHKCYDLIPISTKLVVFDTALPVFKAFYALVHNGMRAAPLWDAQKNQFVGMLTITDFIKILYKHHNEGADEEKIKELETQEIFKWRQRFEEDGPLQPLICIDPNESLFRAVQILVESKVHRLPVMERASGNISYILTHKRIIKFLSLYIHDLPKPAFMDETPKSLGIGSWGEVLSIHMDTPLIEALRIFLKNRVSALPLVDESGKVINIYAKFDVISLAADKVYNHLNVTVHEALQHRSEWFEGVRTCKATDSLFAVMETIVRAEVHRLIVTDEADMVVGVISLSDILKHLVLDRCGDAGCSPATTSASLEAMEAPVFDIPEEEHHEIED